MFCRHNDFRRIATRHDKLARNCLSAVSLAAAVAFWLYNVYFFNRGESYGCQTDYRKYRYTPS